MPFEVLPVLDQMRELYTLPRDGHRFQAYLRLLEGGAKGNLAVPVMHFNPMAKEPLVARLKELRQLDAEAEAAKTLAQLNAAAPPDEQLFHVVLNLADDLHGGWTNRYTTDYASKFELSALVKRGFCTPVFWASETYTPELVRQRTLAQAWRTRYWAQYPQPRTVAEHVAQEQFVAAHAPEFELPAPALLEQLRSRYEAVQHATDRPTLLTFFYGDAAARQLGYREWGNWPAAAGFRLAQAVARRAL